MGAARAPAQHPGCVWQPSWERAVTKEMLTAPQTLSLPPSPTEQCGGGSGEGLVGSEPALCAGISACENIRNCPLQNSVPEPGGLEGRGGVDREEASMGWALRTSPPAPWAAQLVHSGCSETSLAAEPILGEPLPLRKILKASANVWMEPQEEGRAVAWIVLSHLSPHALRHGLGSP